MYRFTFLPTRAEFDRARSTPRAYVLVDGVGLRWVLRPVTAPPRPREYISAAFAELEWRTLLQLQALAERTHIKPVDRSLVVAERMIAEARRG